MHPFVSTLNLLNRLNIDIQSMCIGHDASLPEIESQGYMYIGQGYG